MGRCEGEFTVSGAQDLPDPVDEAAHKLRPAPPPRRRFAAFLFVAFAVSAAAGVYLWWRDQDGVSTDDAFLRADTVQVPAEIGGRIVEVLVRENQHVAAGDLVLRIDDSDLRLKLVVAEANLAAAQMDAQRATDAIAVTRQDIRTAEVRRADAQREQALQEQLAGAGAAVQAGVDRATTTVAVAAQGVETGRAGLRATESAAEAARARVAAALGAVDLARRDLALVEVRAPASGTVSKLELQPGELVQRGQATCVLVADERYAVANFKETDLDRIHVGDRVAIELDAFPKRPLHGMVESIGAGTGSTFSLLPADNASGNFIKVVQRVAVRIALDPGESVTDLPAGISVLATVGGDAR